jgi:prephenate dehydrogenase
MDIGMIGLGRFGAYFTRQLERAGHQVTGVDIRDDPQEACRASLVIYAVPIRALERAIVDTRRMLGPDSVVMDVSSVKSIPVGLLRRYLPAHETVGTHPLFGPDSAPLSCAGQRIAICGTPGPGLDRVEAVANSLGLNIVRCTPEEHDTQVARSQFLTHFIGRGTVGAGVGRLALSTKTHEALMDIVDVVTHDTMELFEDMATFNPMAPAVRAEFLAALQAIDAHLNTLGQERGTVKS